MWVIIIMMSEKKRALIFFPKTFQNLSDCAKICPNVPTMSREGKWTQERRKVNAARAKLTSDLESGKSEYKAAVAARVRRHREEVTQVWAQEDRTFEEKLKTILDDICPPTIMTDPFPADDDERQLVKEYRQMRLDQRVRKEKQAKEEWTRAGNRDEVALNRRLNELQVIDDPSLVADRERIKDQMKEMDELQRTLDNREQLLRALKVEEPPGDADVSPKPKSEVVVNWNKSAEGRSPDLKVKSREDRKADDKSEEQKRKRKEKILKMVPLKADETPEERRKRYEKKKGGK